MKKSKLSLGLVTTFVAALCMAGCSSDVEASGKSLVSIKGYNGDDEVIDVITDDMFAKYGTTTEGITSYYSKILETLIRNEYKKTEGKMAGLSSYEMIAAKAANNVEAAKTEADEKADQNDTKYKEEWQNILDQYGCEDEDELKEYYIYQLEKEEIEKVFLKENETTLKEEFLGVNGKGEKVESYFNGTSGAKRDISSRFPYHIRHILVKVESGANNYNSGTITKAQAENISKVVKALASDIEIFSFGAIAERYSEDTGSGANYGDVGIMTNKASADGSLTMVPEFQLGLYAYDSLVNPEHLGDNINAVISEGLGTTEFEASDLTPVGTTSAINGLVEVPYSVFEDLSEFADATTVFGTDDYEYSLKDYKEAIYPRNILWNKYLNHHNPFIITNRSRTKLSDDAFVSKYTSAGIVKTNVINDEKSAPNQLDSTFDAMTDATHTGMRHMAAIKDFANVQGLDSNMMALTDENANIIIGVRSEFGLHFMVIQKSIYDFSEHADGATASTDPATLNKVTLEEYYTTEVPEVFTEKNMEKLEPNYKYPHVTDVDGSGKIVKVTDKATYVNFISGSTSTYSKRAEEVKSAIKGYDSTYDYRLYEYLFAANSANIKLKDSTIKDAIENYFATQRATNKYNQEKGLNKAWESYFEMLSVQEEARTNKTQMIPEGCAIGFKKNNGMNTSIVDSLYSTGVCNYGK